MDKTIFISCGQFSESEKLLGKEIERLVKELTPFNPYFAEDQSTFEGLTQNIFGALNDCSAFIGVMHRRGEVSTLDRQIIRASVWIEQEIAIAAFLQHVFDRDLPVRVYIEQGIQREGVRDKLLLNPIEFHSNLEILADLRATLPAWAGTLRGAPRAGLHFEIRHRRENTPGEYRFQVWLKNDGPSSVDDYVINVGFPREFIRSSAALFDLQPPVPVYRLTPQSPGFRKIFPESELAVVDFAYYVGPNDPTCQNALSKEAVVSLYAGDARIQQERMPVADLV